MKKALIISLLLLSLMLFSQNKEWPILKHYDQNHLGRIALPIGGIGTGTVSIGGRGELQDWEIMNRPAKGFRTTKSRLDAPFFSIFTKTTKGSTKTKALLGPLYDWEYEHMEGRSIEHHGLPRFESASFNTAYPFGQVSLEDKNMPVKITLKAFNPLIPGDADASGIPIAVLSYEVTNTTDQTIDVSVCGSMRNFIGVDGSKMQKDWKGEYYPVGAKYNKNKYQTTEKLKGIYMYSDSVQTKDPAWGSIALTTGINENTSYRTGTVPDAWGNSILNFWDDFSEDGILQEEAWSFDHQPMASLAISKKLEAGETKNFTFYLTWYFPNRTSWYGPDIVGNYYTEQYDDAWNVIEKEYPKLPELENRTIEFVDAFINSDLPEVVKEAALFNISTLRSQTVFRIKDGHMFGWEGVMDDIGSCMGSCTHVWNYEQTTAFLFGDLAKSMRDVEFGYATHDNGLMSFRVNLPLDKAQSSSMAAADGQMGTIMKFYRDWQLSGDQEFLNKHYENVKKALAFAWIEGGWDADIDGVMEGCQHNTMDVEYFGPNPQMQIWYLGALKAGKEMAITMDDQQFANVCDELFNKGSIWTDENLFNGEYYEQIIKTPENSGSIASGLTVGMGASDINNPDFQLAKGCLVDQLVGQYMAHVCGLGYLINPDHAKTTLNSIMKYNYRESLNDHFNNMRSYAMGNESALLMASWPKGRPKVPFPYFSEVMTGFEYTAAVGMLYEGQAENGLKCIKSIRDRYDGSKRNPFDEAECGHHYARAMASWSSVLALTGFQYSGVDRTIRFGNIEGEYFWSTGYAYGTVEILNKGSKKEVKLHVLKGSLNIHKITIQGFGEQQLKSNLELTEGSINFYQVKNNNKQAGIPQYQLKEIKTTSVIRAPHIKDANNKIFKTASFTDTKMVHMESEPGSKIYYTLDGSLPTENSLVYIAPIKLSESAIIKAIAVKNGFESFLSTTAEVFKVRGFEHLELLTKPSPKYKGKDANTLFDGIKGNSSFSDGKCLGFEGDDLVLIISFKDKTKVNTLIINCLINEGSWIFPPQKIEFYKSIDAKTYEIFGVIDQKEIGEGGENNTMAYRQEFENTEIQHLKIKVINTGVCPEGHPGAGEKAWLFIDEIIIE